MKMRILKLFIYALNFLFLVQCSSSNEKKKQTAPPIISGKINQNISCIHFPNEHYAAYLPSNYTRSKSWPVIYMLDSHGEALTPVEKYKEIAEKYGYILIASYNSKNGLILADQNTILFNLFEDSQNRLNIDKNRVYLAGFSGGARVATYYALNNPSIAGVIGCGAGFGEIKNPASEKLNYIGFVGTEDFNYTEFLMLQKSLDSLNFKHQIVYFKGEHAWAPASYMEEAFMWQIANAMRDNKIQKDAKMINAIKRHFDDSLSVLNKSGNSLKLFKLYKQAINYLDQLVDISEYSKKIALIKKDKSYLDALKNDEQINKSETVLRDKFSHAFETKNIDWWKNEVKQLSAEKNNLLLERNKRVLNLCSLMAYMYAGKTMNASQMDVTKKLLQIYELVDPDNSETYYMNARWFMLNKQSNEALSYLEKALFYKFNDIDRLINDPAFESLKQNVQFLDVIDKMKKIKK